ncbi:DNA repair protein rhp57 [Coemansia sp. RSA 989]|nr:DNA repair protein rhp57 [Coemansia sp. RSA 1086]KAJ1866085.1 DNA repair protein rhp57 [Coemansia sp. RSA 989]
MFTEEERQLLSKCKAKIGCEQLTHCMLMPYSEFLRTTGLCQEQAQRAWTLISKAYPWQQHMQKASVGAEQWLTTGDSHIDRLLGGGIRMGSIVEVVGESAAGKTQFCLQLAIAAQLPRDSGGIGGDVVYVSTEGAVPTGRLATMIGPFSRAHKGMQAASIMQHIQVAELEDMETMFHALNYKIPALLATGKVRLVIIDSIAAHLRFDLDGEGSRKSQDFYKERSSLLIQLGAKFKKWAAQYSCTFVCVNQVKDVFQPQSLLRDTNDSEQSTQASGADLESEFAMVRSNKAPALGAIWASIVNVRIMLYQRRGLAPSLSDTPEESRLPEHLLRTRRWIENT